MTAEEIGANAGKIYEALKGGAALSVKELEKATELKGEALYLSLGWLFKEGNIRTETKVEKKKSVEVIAWN